MVWALLSCCPAAVQGYMEPAAWAQSQQVGQKIHPLGLRGQECTHVVISVTLQSVSCVSYLPRADSQLSSVNWLQALGHWHRQPEHCSHYCAVG